MTLMRIFNWAVLPPFRCWRLFGQNEILVPVYRQKQIRIGIDLPSLLLTSDGW